MIRNKFCAALLIRNTLVQHATPCESIDLQEEHRFVCGRRSDGRTSHLLMKTIYENTDGMTAAIVSH